MAFMGRGSISFDDNDNIEDINDNDNVHRISTRMFWGRRFYYYIPLDNTYVVMQMITTFIILIVGAISYLITYKSTIIDPIENIKRLFINLHSILIMILVIMTIIVHLYSKKESILLKMLLMIGIISVLIMLIFLGIKLDLDWTYTETKFEQLYLEHNINEIKSGNTKIDIGITGMSIKTEKEYYIDECIKLYNIFKIKCYITLGLHMLLNILIIYQIFKVHKIQNKKEKLDKNDLILFDEEQNVKI